MAKRILVVESDTALGRVLCDNFEFEGFEVRSAGDPRGAMGEVRAFAPDLIVVDVAAPGDGAASLLACLRQECSTPVLVLDADSRRQAAVASRIGAAGGGGVGIGGLSGLLPKPFDLDDLLQCARALLALPATTVRPGPAG